jgi:hypothetical protein
VAQRSPARRIGTDEDMQGVASAFTWSRRSRLKQPCHSPKKDLMAVNSRPGRSQDQLHIHIDCLRRRYVQLLRQHGAGLSAEKWTRLTSALHGRYYWAVLIDSSDRPGTYIPHRRDAVTCLARAHGGRDT